MDIDEMLREMIVRAIQYHEQHPVTPPAPRREEVTFEFSPREIRKMRQIAEKAGEFIDGGGI